MSPSDLSTPQKILRNSLKSKLPPAPSPPHFAPPPTPPMAVDSGEAERRRMERIRLGRESLERRRLQGGALSLSRSSSVRADGDGDADMDWHSREIDTPPSSTGETVEKKTMGWIAEKYDGDAPYVPDNDSEHDDDDDDDAETRKRMPRRSGRKFTKAAIQKENELERQRELRQKDQEELRSRFIEGSMRDRASAPPPRDIVGELGGGEDAGDYEEYLPPFVVQEGEKEKEKKRRGFTFGLGSLFKFNPFTLVDEARAAYIRQKALHESRERQKEEMKKQKREVEQLYLQMKARGEFRGTFVDENAIGRAISTDDGPAANLSEMVGSARKRKRGEITSVKSEMDDAMPEYFQTCSGGEDNEELEYMEDTEVDEPEDEVVRSIRYEDTTIPLYSRGVSSKGSEEKHNSVRSLVKKTSNVFATALTSTTSNTSSTTLAKGVSTKPLTKREIQKQERLLKKVSNLEEQLEKARRELDEVAGGAIPPVPALPSEMMAPPPPPPHSTPVSRSSQDSKRNAKANSKVNSKANGMPPPAPTMKGTLDPKIPTQKPAPRNPNQILPDTPEPTPAGDRFAPGVMSPSTDEDTTMDEDFSMIPLSPVLNSSSVADSTGALAVSSARRNGVRSKSPRMPGFRKISGTGARKVSSALSSAVNSTTADGKPDRKKLKKVMDSQPPPKKSWVSSEGVLIPKLPINGTAQ